MQRLIGSKVVTPFVVFRAVCEPSLFAASIPWASHLILSGSHAATSSTAGPGVAVEGDALEAAFRANSLLVEFVEPVLVKDQKINEWLTKVMPLVDPLPSVSSTSATYSYLSR